MADVRGAGPQTSLSNKVLKRSSNGQCLRFSGLLILQITVRAQVLTIDGPTTVTRTVRDREIEDDWMVGQANPEGGPVGRTVKRVERIALVLRTPTTSPTGDLRISSRAEGLAAIRR